MSGFPQENLWAPGTELLDGYVIRKLLGRGGMGAVFLVEREISSGTLQFAMKIPLTGDLDDPKFRDQFIRELRTWINLPEYPHLAACRFFRTIHDRLAIFADYIKGGSLREWIRENRLDTLEKILDVAIQFAWGLDAAHRCGLVHQDIKPANVLMTPDGIVKITDFGLSRVSGVPGSEGISISSGSSPMVSSSGMTLAYCSPEQATGLKLDHRTDLWSFGVSLLEMFSGRVSWKVGLTAPSVMENWQDLDQPPRFPEIPEPVRKILNRCFMKCDLRWSSAMEIADALVIAYTEITGVEYHRVQPEFTVPVVSATPEITRITRYGAQWTPGMEYIEDACNDTGTPIPVTKSDEPLTHQQIAFNDLELYNKAEKIYSKFIASQNDRKLVLCLSRLLCHKAHILAYLNDTPGALLQFDLSGTIILQHSDDDLTIHEKNRLALNFMGKATLLNHQNKSDRALKYYNDAIDLWDSIPRENTEFHPGESLAMAYTNKGSLLREQGEILEIITILDKAIDELNDYSEFHNEHPDTIRLAQIYTHKASMLEISGKGNDAIALLMKAAHILESNQLNEKTDLNVKIAINTAKLASAFRSTGNTSEAGRYYKSAIERLEKDVFHQGNESSEFTLSQVYSNLAATYYDDGEYVKALAAIEKPIAMLHCKVTKEGRMELLGYYHSYRLKKAQILLKYRKGDDARTIIRESLPVMETEFTRTGRKNFKDAIRDISASMESTGFKRDHHETNLPPQNQIEKPRSSADLSSPGACK